MHLGCQKQNTLKNALQRMEYEKYRSRLELNYIELDMNRDDTVRKID